jgi:hypothetical protein
MDKPEIMRMVTMHEKEECFINEVEKVITIEYRPLQK